MKNKKHTSDKIASLAGQTLQNNNASAIQRQLAACALSQHNTDKQTGAELEDIASRVLNSPKYNETTKSLAGAVLSQSNHEK
ncbi:MAG: hypothetical protein H6Q72_1936 [Firmicutes bacterium]|nr:hypothetical protein [Bacillota bacterium]